MSQYSAVYYPHTTLRDKSLLQTSLLLWDHVDCIVPWQGYSVTQGLTKQLAEAAEIVLRPRHPSPKEKEKVHDSVVSVFHKGVPAWVNASLKVDSERDHPLHEDRDYLIYPQKFMRETWKELSRLSVAQWLPKHRDYGVPPALGLTLMASLADACAGEQQHRVTDRVDAYAAIAGMTTASLGGEQLANVDASHVASGIDRLITTSTNVMNGSAPTLKRIVALRRREAKESGHGLRGLRHNYLDAVKAHLSELNAAASLNDAKELARQFREKMEMDLADLKDELGMARNDLLLSKEMLVLTAAAAGAVAAPITAPALLSTVKAVGVGALIADGVKYKRARAKAFRAHLMSWLYLAQRPRRAMLA